MLKKEYMVTSTGLKKLEEELDILKTQRRAEVAEKIKIARGYGDLSENSEYDEAKNEQAMLESRIAEVEVMLKHIKVVDEDELTNDEVMVGTHVRLKDEDGEEEAYDIVGSSEADPLANKISDESPVGSALIGKRVGDTVEVNLPTGAIIKYDILQIEKSAI